MRQRLLGSPNIAPGKRYPGSKYFLNTSCNKKGDSLFIADDLAFVIFSVLNWLRIAGGQNTDGSVKPAKVYMSQLFQDFMPRVEVLRTVLLGCHRGIQMLFVVLLTLVKGSRMLAALWPRRMKGVVLIFSLAARHLAVLLHRETSSLLLSMGLLRYI